MADRIRFGVNLTPIETLTDENGGSRDIVASEVGRSLSASGESIDLNFAYNSFTAAQQGYLNATVNYISASHSAGGSALGNLEPDFIFIKNTGYKFSTANVLGAATTDCVMVVFRVPGYESAVNSGWATDAVATQPHFFEVAWLKPGQGIVLPAGGNKYGITQFGANTGDFTNLSNSTASGEALIYVRTFLANGSAAASANAVEFLAVT